MLILEVIAYVYSFPFLLSSPCVIDNTTNIIINSKVELLYHIDLIKVGSHMTKKIGIDLSLIDWDTQRFSFIKIP